MSHVRDPNLPLPSSSSHANASTSKFSPCYEYLRCNTSAHTAHHSKYQLPKMSSSYIPQGTTTRLTPADLDASSKSAINNMEQKAFCEWPNEAGVSTPTSRLRALIQLLCC